MGAPPIFYVVLFVIGIVDFFTGLMEAYVYGVLYCSVLIFFGAIIDEWGSVLTGLIVIFAFAAGVVIRRMSDGD